MSWWCLSLTTVLLHLVSFQIPRHSLWWDYGKVLPVSGDLHLHRKNLIAVFGSLFHIWSEFWKLRIFWTLSGLLCDCNLTFAIGCHNVTVYNMVSICLLARFYDCSIQCYNRIASNSNSNQTNPCIVFTMLYGKVQLPIFSCTRITLG